MRSKYKKILSVCVVGLFVDTLPARTLEVCGFCDETITLDEVLANCYLEKVDGFISKIDNSGKKFTQVNLGSCLDFEDGRRGGVDKFPIGVMPKPGVVKITKYNFLLDRPSLECIKHLIKQKNGSFAAVWEINLTENC